MNNASDKIGFLKSIFNQVRLVVRLIKDARVPVWMKILPFAPLLYVLFPLDIVPDVLPIVGQLDDLGVVLLGLQSFVAIAPQDLVQQHRDDIAADKPFGVASTDNNGTKETIDGSWKVVDKNE